MSKEESGEKKIRINRRFTPINADEAEQQSVERMAPSDQNWREGTDSPQRRRERRELIFCLSEEGDKQKLIYFGQQPDLASSQIIYRPINTD